MSTGYILSIAFVVIVTILLWILIGAKGKWWIKLLLIALVPAYSVVILVTTAHDAKRNRGWPTEDEPPREAILLWGVIHEPGDRGKGDPGSIEVMLIPLDDSCKEAGEPKGTPRNFRMPYSRNLHQAVQEGNERTKQGRSGTLKRGGKPADKHGQGRHGGRGRGQAGQSEEGGEYHSYDLPPPAIPKGPL